MKSVTCVRVVASYNTWQPDSIFQHHMIYLIPSGRLAQKKIPPGFLKYLFKMNKKKVIDCLHFYISDEISEFVPSICLFLINWLFLCLFDAVDLNVWFDDARIWYKLFCFMIFRCFWWAKVGLERPVCDR